MKALSRYILPLLWIGVVVTGLWFRRDIIAYDKSFYMIIVRALMVNPSPIGEVVAGFHLEQPINWTLLNKTTLAKEAAEEVCVKYLLANYNDRDNDGTFAMSLRTADHLHRVVVDAKKVRDNAYHQVCFHDVLLGDIANRTASLILEGIDGRPGHAITAWTTKDTLHGGALWPDGTEADTSLAFRLETLHKGKQKIVPAIILAIISALSGVAVFWAVQGKAAKNTKREIPLTIR